jgi:hypothetical protein
VPWSPQTSIIPLKQAVEDVDAAIATFDLIREINEADEREGADQGCYGADDDYAGLGDCSSRTRAAWRRRLPAPESLDARRQLNQYFQRLDSVVQPDGTTRPQANSR